MGGQEFNDGKKMAYYGYGLDEDCQEVMEMSSLEMASLTGFSLLSDQGHQNKLIHDESPGFSLLSDQGHHNKLIHDESPGFSLLLDQEHHNKITHNKCIHSECEGLRLMPDQRHHNKHNCQLTSKTCVSHAPRYLGDYPKVTLLGGPLSHTHLHRGNCVPELHNGFCQSLVQQRHNKMINAADFDSEDANTELNDTDETEAICDGLAPHYAQDGLKDPEGYFDSADEEFQTVMSPNRGGQGAGDKRDVGTVELNVFERSQDSESIENLRVTRILETKNSWDTTL